MAIYYIDPHLSTTTATAGTWADPWTLAQATKSPTIVNGDEIRIKGVALTSLLTATTYTATLVDSRTLTITAGGGLGADFFANNIIYFPDNDTFAKVWSSSSNNISISSSVSMIMPWGDSSTTSLTIRKVNTTTYPASTTGTSYNFTTPSQSPSNITVSDCWTSASTRVTDGTVKTLINTTSGSGSSLWLDTQSGTTSTGYTYNCTNTHIMPPNNSSNLTHYIRANNSTYNINQISSFSAAATSSFAIGQSGSPSSNITVNLKHYVGYSLLNPTLGGNNVAFNIDNLYCSQPDYLFNTSGSGAAWYSPLTITLGKVVAINLNSAFVYAQSANDLTINFNGILDVYTAASSFSYFFQGYGQATLNFGPSFTYYRNKRTVTTPPTFNNIVYFNGNTYTDNLYIPNISLPTGWTQSQEKWALLQTRPYSTIGGSVIGQFKEAEVRTISLPDTSIPNGTPYTFADTHTNVLVVHRNGAAPKEILGIGGNRYQSNNQSFSAPHVTTDASVFRTTGPSMKANLATLNAAYWIDTATAIKNIRIPVVSGNSYTVSGYIRTDDTAYANGDCKVWVVSNNASLATQSMTTACVNAWEQFTLTFTATQTGEVQFAWEMHFSNGAKSYWLDDLTVT